MKKEELISVVKMSGIKEKVVLTSKAALVMNGIADDVEIIDCYAKEEYYNELIETLTDPHKKLRPCTLGGYHVKYNGVDVHFNRDLFKCECVTDESGINYVKSEYVLKEYDALKNHFKSLYEKYEIKYNELSEKLK